MTQRQILDALLEGSRSSALDTLGGAADALHRAGRQLGDGRADGSSPPIEQAARGLDMACEFLNHRSTKEMAAEVGRFARREPALFLGGAFLVGLLGGRYLARSERRLQADDTQDPEETARCSSEQSR
jgi:hypothetical protein